MVRRGAAQAGMVIGDRYAVIAPLAEGGFGSVYEAEQITTERRVALKLVSGHPDDSTEYMLGEARLASRLQSENIVQIVDAGIDHATGAVFVVMDLLTGSTLGDLIDTHGPRDAKTTVDFVRQIANGLEKAHTYVDREGTPAPIVHRDLKPANIFVTRREDGSPLLKILDFGTAKMLSAKAASSRIVRGTPQFMAPEQLAGDRPTPATDIWALGLVTFYVLTGHSYWLAVARDAPAEALFNELHVLPLVKASQRARELGSSVELPPAFDAWFARCIERQPSRRYASAARVAEELARALSVPSSGSKATAPVVELDSSEMKPVRSVETLGMTASAAWTPTERRRRSRAGLLLTAVVVLGLGAAGWFALGADDGAPETAPSAR
ncbi:MAG: serine/threonine protein kinase, partial [Myxococcota bacterium]|nr:serine/threonine protein kinase [Myxococcota bacterium]